MILKNNYRPAFATAGASFDQSARKNAQKAIMFNSADEAEDFNAFQDSSAPQRAPQKPKKNKGRTLELSLKTLLIALASLVALILLIVVIVAAVNSSGSPMTAENNSFVSYEQEGLYYVAMNGEIVGDSFENPLELVSAKDNSFAYVFEETPDGYNAYILAKKELTLITTTAVGKIVAWADYKPGIVYQDEGSFYFYSEDTDGKITKNATASNFVIAPDASAVSYIEAKDGDLTKMKLYLYTNGNDESYANNMYPVAVAPGGKYIYAYGIDSSDGITKKLYMIPANEDEDKCPIDTNFNSITYMNIKGDEIIYTTNTITENGIGFISNIYNAKKNETYKIGAGYCVPLISDPSVVALSTLKDIVVENIPSISPLSTGSATYYVGKDYTPKPISNYNGQLNASEDIFYFITADNVLKYIDLNEKTRSSKEVAEDVVEFVVTAKDNIYFIDDEARLRFHKTSTGKSTTIYSADEVVSMSLNKYSNVLYFEVKDDTKAYSTEEGSAKEIAEFARAEIRTTPTFTSVGQKRTFAYVKNADTDLYDVYYTSTGTTYKLIAEGCERINGIEDTAVVVPPSDDNNNNQDNQNNQNNNNQNNNDQNNNQNNNNGSEG